MRYDRIFLIVITIGITFSILPFVTAEDPVTVSTSKDIYYEGDTVIVFGKISGAFGGLPVIIELYHGDSLIAVDQIEIALDGSFATDFTASGQFWNEDGTKELTEFVDGELNGPLTVWHPNGKLKEESYYVNWVAQGPFTFYDEEGEKIYSGEYKDGKVDWAEEH